MVIIDAVSIANTFGSAPDSYPMRIVPVIDDLINFTVKPLFAAQAFGSDFLSGRVVG